MGFVGLGLSEATPADHAAGPVATSRGVVRDESLKADRWRALPAAIRISIIGNAGVRAAARSRQHEQPLVLLDKCLEIVVSHARIESRLLDCVLSAKRSSLTLILRPPDGTAWSCVGLRTVGGLHPNQTVFLNGADSAVVNR